MKLRKYIQGQNLPLKGLVQISFENKDNCNKSFNIFFSKEFLLQREFNQAKFRLKNILGSNVSDISKNYKVIFWKSEGARLVPIADLF